MDHSKFFRLETDNFEKNIKNLSFLNFTFKLAEIVEGAVFIPFIPVNHTTALTSGFQTALPVQFEKLNPLLFMRSFMVFKLTA